MTQPLPYRLSRDPQYAGKKDLSVGWWLIGAPRDEPQLAIERRFRGSRPWWVTRTFSPDIPELRDELDRWLARHNFDATQFRLRRNAYGALLIAAAEDPPPGYGA